MYRYLVEVLLFNNICRNLNVEDFYRSSNGLLRFVLILFCRNISVEDFYRFINDSRI